jgi:hypothetical protein
VALQSLPGGSAIHTAQTITAGTDEITPFEHPQAHFVAGGDVDWGVVTARLK